MDCNMPGIPVLHYFPKFAQTHVQWVGDAIQPSRPLSSPSPSAFNLSQHQGLFQHVGCLHQVAKILASAWASVLPMNIQGWFPWGWTGLISLLTKGLSRVFSNTTVQRHQFFCTQSILLCSSHICTWLLEKSVLIIQNLVGKESVSGSQLAPTLDSACVSGLSPVVAATTSLPLKLCLEIPGSHPRSQSSSGQLCTVCAGPTPHSLNVDIAQGQCLEGRTNGGSLKANVSTSGLTSVYTDTLACSPHSPGKDLNLPGQPPGSASQRQAA